MTMAVENHQQRHLGGMGYDHMSYQHHPQFTNPWCGPTSQQYPPRPTTMSMPYSSLPASAPPTGNGNYPNVPFQQSELLTSSQELLNGSRSTYDHSYTSAPSQSSYAPSSASYAPIGSYAPSIPQHPQHERQLPQTSGPPLSQSHAAAFEAIDGARGMVAMSQDITPRNIYGPRGDRGSVDSYGFPPTHSSHSSISSASTYPHYFSPSVDSSVTDYSSASESMDGVNSRTLPRPSGLAGSVPPAPSSMMGSFNSKVSASTQKKHKCKVCDKRFTRPSSLQTHMYSHTGEKPFACEIPGCGRNFSVVSNLRRHRKVHKDDLTSDHGSPEGSWTSKD